ncbi:MAG TPA: GHKL domain-containing protein, partial [Proteobacteria bacterium]|nr:GHKL domain-containing protein [Pseudomonadota bacterium]
IKNPLTAIRAASEAIELGLRSMPNAEPDLIACSEAIIRQTDGLKRLVDRLGHLAQAGEIRKQTADLAALIKETVQNYSATHPHISFDLHLDAGIPPFAFDPEQMERVLANLIDNAISAIEGEGRISITTRLDGNMVRVDVADDGKGIPQEFLDRLFEPHFSTKRRGTGLGLAIVHRIVAEHGGSVSISPNEPKGTVVSLEIPVS